MKNTNNGITLIALIITIIVMLILVAVTISMAVNGGLFEKAANAGRQTNEAVIAEQELGTGRIKIGNTWYDSPQDFIDGKQSKNQGNGEQVKPETPGDEEGLPSYANAQFENGLLDENAKFESDGKTAVIPKGFKIINGIEGTQSIAAGLVIQDAEGNEFVWIPVTYTPSEEIDERGLDTNFKNTFVRSIATDSYHSEPYTNGYTNEDGTTEVDDYYDMMLSVQNNGGFYVGRYEAGIETTGNPRVLFTEDFKDYENGDSPMVVKRDCYPYNFVVWGESMSNYTNPIEDYNGNDQGYGAVYLSKDLIDNEETGATSTLMYGVQWDAMLRFMGKENETNSTKLGNYYNNAIIIDRQTARYTTDPDIDLTWTQINTLTDKQYPKTDNEGILLTTGASDKFEEKNIYDVAGNVIEWTMEAGSSDRRVFRGGSYYDGGDGVPAPDRDYDYPGGCYKHVRFPPRTLYNKQIVCYIKRRSES